MSQSRSQGRRAHTSSGSQPAMARAGSLDSTSSSQHSVQDIEDDIDALTKEVYRLGKEFIASTEEYDFSLSKARRIHKDTRTAIFTDFLTRVQDISLNSKPEDMKKQACEELETAAQNKLSEIKGRIDNQAKEIEAERSGKSKTNAARKVMNRAKANAIKGDPEEIKKVAGTPVGMQEIEKCRARLAGAYMLVEKKVHESYERYMEKMESLKGKQEKTKETLDKKNIPEVPEDRAEAATRVNNLGSLEPKDYKAGIQREDAGDKRMNLLEK